MKEILGADKVKLSHKLIKVTRDGSSWLSTFSTGPTTTAVSAQYPTYSLCEIISFKLLSFFTGVQIEGFDNHFSRYM